ncbi:MAG: nitrilase-related carbon-nitrogen hydrolase [Saprospiraceae bacterium]|nr:carbon-nitrogen family hydrolase [Saprospiraceae bacterium]MBP7642590.1 hypothetical protein [Saprospiraceae bacterium]
MKIATYQFESKLGQVDYNLNKIITILESEEVNNFDIVVFPEMSDTGYDMQVIKDYAVVWGNDHLTPIMQLAVKQNICIILGLSEKVEDKVYNTVAVIDNTGNLTYKYRKTHLVTIKPISEELFITPGDHLGIFSILGIKVGVMTCYELRFPEIARTLTLRGIQILFVPTAWPFARVDHFVSLLIARAIENQIFIVACGRVGTDAGIKFAGNSMIIDPFGKIIARASDSLEGIVSGIVDLNQIEQSRNLINALDERRSDLYKLG